jgi:hypothetical protein
LLLIAAATLAAADWKPVDPAELALKAPKVEKDAHAEALFWEVWVSDETSANYPHTIMSHYLRIKIFDESGVEKYGKVEIPYFGKTSVSDVAGRTIHPDGSVQDLTKDAIFDRDMVKAKGLKMRARTFALPGVTPGSIVEYRWKERDENALANYVPLRFQRDIPVESVTYHIKPLVNPYFPYQMQSITFHTDNGAVAQERGGFIAVTHTNMPAVREEPRMPPEYEVQAWMLIFYEENRKLTADKYWKDRGRTLYNAWKPQMKVSGEVKQTAASVMEDAKTDDEKLRRLFHYCRNSIKNVNDPGSGLSAEKRNSAKDNKTPADTIRQGMGTGSDINLLFAALATAAGFDARLAWVADRSQFFFNPATPSSWFLRATDVAVEVDGKWQFFDPASTYVPYGMLRWQEENTAALITDPKEPVIMATPLAPPAKSQRKRTGKFTLDEAGTLEGDVTIEYTGHEAVDRRRAYQAEDAAQREESLRETVKDQFGEAEVTSIALENVADADKPLIATYRVKIPAYAQRTGKRLFVQPAFFKKNVPPMFPAGERRYPIYFSFPWMEKDRVSITVPEGYALDNPDLPGPMNFTKVGHYKVSATIDKSTRTLVYDRELVFAENGGLVFPVETYAALKTAFDRIAKADEHVISLKQEAK